VPEDVAQCGVDVARLGDDLDARLGEQQLEPRADDRVVVRQDDGDAVVAHHADKSITRRCRRRGWRRA